MAGVSLLPFVEFRANRIVSGVLHPLFRVAGVWGWALAAIVLAAVAVAAFAPPARRGTALLACGAGGVSAWLLALGGSAAALMPSGVSAARVSIASGGWVLVVGLAVIWFQGARSTRSVSARVAAFAVVVVALLAGWFVGGLPKLALVLEYYAESDTFWSLVGTHVVLSIGGTAIATVLGIPLGIAASRVPAVRATIIPVAGIVQTIPSLALYGLLVVPLGMLGLPTLGTVPALIALTLYALLPIVRNTFLGISAVDPAIIVAGRGMGMRRVELLARVELPLALPLMLEGVRTSLVMTVGVAAVMAIIGANTLGTLVLLGWGQVAVDLVLLGALPMVVLSIVADQLMRAVERVAVSPGIRYQDATR